MHNADVPFSPEPREAPADGSLTGTQKPKTLEGALSKSVRAVSTVTLLRSHGYENVAGPTQRSTLSVWHHVRSTAETTSSKT